MLTGLENGIGLDVVVWLQAHGSPLADFLAQAIHILGSPSWYLFLLLPLLLLWNRNALTPTPSAASPSRRGEKRILQWFLADPSKTRAYQWISVPPAESDPTTP